MDNITEDLCLRVDQDWERFMNFASLEYPTINQTHGSLTWREYLKIASYINVMLATIIGNLGIIITVGLNNSMRTTINIYVVNLAIADMLICFFCMWVHLVSNLIRDQYVLGSFMCSFNPFAQMTCLTASVLTLSAISCDRFIAIMFPLHVRITKQRTSAVITVIWIISLIVSIPFPIYRKYIERQWKDFLEIQCSDIWPTRVVYSEELNRCVSITTSKKIYYTFVSITLFFLPIFVMISSYSLIIWRLWVSELPGERNLANINVQHRAKKKVIKMVFVVLVVFIVCWMPLQVILLYSQYGHSSHIDGQLPSWFHDLNYYATFIAYSNSAMNPIIYGGFNNNFRQAFLKIFKCRCPTKSIRRPNSTNRLSSSRFIWRFSKNRTVSTFPFSS